jgi:hypothetical protein
VSLRRKKLTAIAEQRQADDAALDLEDATPREEMALFAASGVTVLVLNEVLGGARAVKGIEPTGKPDPDVIEHVRARVRQRRRLGLPHVDCLTDDCSCGSLTSALDELDEDATKAKIQRTARKLHKARNPVFAPLPIPPVQAEPPVEPERPTTRPAPIPAAVVNETQTKPFRVVKKRQRWYDDDRGGNGIMNRQF